MECENCKERYEESAGSKRFCSLKCAKSFSTKAKRKEINSRVSEKLSKTPIIYNNVCKSCLKQFESINIERKVCSRECLGNYLSKIQKGGTKKKGAERKIGSGGLRDGGGKSKVFEYISSFGEMMKLNREEIKIAKILDESGMKWNRNWKGFSYEKNRKFYPDFYVQDLNLYVEYKGWLTDSMRDKMKNSKIDNLKIVVGSDKRYVEDGMNVQEFENFLQKVKINFRS